MKVESDRHDIVLIMSAIDKPLANAHDEDVALIEWAVGISDSPSIALEFFITSTSQPAIVDFAAARYGLVEVIKI